MTAEDKALKLALEFANEWAALARTGSITGRDVSAKRTSALSAFEKAFRNALAQPEKRYKTTRNAWTGKATYKCKSCGRDDFRSEHGAHAHVCETLEQPEQEPVGINGLTEAETNATASVMGLVNTPPKRKPLTGDNTTFVQRFTDAVAILCGAEPPADLVDEWLRNVDVNGVHRLQEWVLNQEATPQWAQGIVVLDAAHVLATSPVEGEQHKAANDTI